jgi:hypothetical protein
MVDFKKTAEEYERKGVKFDDPTLELTRVQKWERQVTDENKNFNIDPSDKNKVYPERSVEQILRKIIVDEDGAEYLTTIETWYGRDGMGNEIPLPVSEPQCYQSPNVRTTKEMRDGRYETIKTPDGFKIIHTTPFSREAAQEAYNRSRKSTVSLLVKEVGLGRKPVKVKDFNDWVERPVYDILDGKPKATAEKVERKNITSQKREVEQLTS